MASVFPAIMSHLLTSPSYGCIRCVLEFWHICKTFNWGISRDCARDRVTPVGPARSQSNGWTSRRPELHTHRNVYVAVQKRTDVRTSYILLTG